MLKSENLNSMSTNTESINYYITDLASSFYELNIMILKIKD